MGMFDHIKYKNKIYQTKDTPNQWMSNYEIRDDGTLWEEECDSEWIKDETALFGAYIKEYNHRWVKVENFTGEIFFYSYDGKGEDIEISSYFIKGELKNLVVLKNETNSE